MSEFSHIEINLVVDGIDYHFEGSEIIRTLKNAKVTYMIKKPATTSECEKRIHGTMKIENALSEE